ncbi:MAG TPA: IclR family transcriptional regulator [Gaiellaceae bacterium]|nr:IclR family transcriptional regulator [Gaiellaceae bacterium]
MLHEARSSEKTKAGRTTRRPRVQSAHRAVAILLAVAQTEHGLTTREISERLHISRQATYHLLHTLLATGVVTRDERNRYLLGLRVATLAEGFSRQLAPSEHLGPMVRAVAKATGESAYGAGWWHGEIATLAVVRGTKPISALELPQGYTGKAHARASGKLLLAYARPDVREAYLETHPLEAATPNTITSRAALDRELERIRAQRYATDVEEFAPELCCLAVPLDEGYSPFVLALAVPRDRFHEQLEAYLAAMRDVVDMGG